MRIAIAALIAAAMVAGASAAGDQPQVAAGAAILMDAETGQVLYEKNADQRRPVASTTKIMTALVLLERADLDATCTASIRAAETPQASIWLEPGERLRLEHLLRAILVKSANDACVAAAEAVAGSEEAFVELMNQRASELGAANTHFVNTHGLHHPEHYSTARDLALITRQALRLSEFRELVSTRATTMPWSGKGYERVLVSKNRLLGQLRGADGVKTGYVRESGQCLVASATRGGWTLMAVLLDSPDLWAEAPALLEYGFDHFRALRFAQRGEPVITVPVRGGARGRVRLAPAETLMLVVPKSGDQECAPRVELAQSRIDAPVRAGEKMGRMVLGAGEREVMAVDLLAMEEVPRSLGSSIRFGTTWFLFSLVAAAMAVRSYSVATKRYRTRRLRVRLSPAQQEPPSRVFP